MNIDLDASPWKTQLDFAEALLAALGAPDWHGRSPDALLDSMIWGGINEVEPPYTVRIFNTAALPATVIDAIHVLKHYLVEHRQEFQKREGHDIEVEMKVFDNAPDEIN